jgi:SET domain-containing protein
MPVPRTATLPARAKHRVRRSGIHGRGLFAAQAVRTGERVAEYTGKIRNAEDGGAEMAANHVQAGPVHLFELAEGVYVDGDAPGNAARFANHSCAPNCEMVEERGRLWLVARRAVAAGEELTFDYGFRLREFLGHRCRCGAPGCAGFIVNARERWRARRLLGRQGRSLVRPAGEAPA